MFEIELIYVNAKHISLGADAELYSWYKGFIGYVFNVWGYLIAGRLRMAIHPDVVSEVIFIKLDSQILCRQWKYHWLDALV